MLLFPHSRPSVGWLQGWPCAGPISSAFGARDIEEHAEGHTGVDIAAGAGTLVHAPAPGLVRDVFIDRRRGTPWDGFKALFGNAVILDHVEAGYVTLYAHLRDAPFVHEGQPIDAGTLLGVVGSTGTSTGPHLHWGMAPRLEQGQPSYLPRHAVVDPLRFCTQPIEGVEELAARLDAVIAEVASVAMALRSASRSGLG